MTNKCLGHLAIARAGHDSEKVYVIVGEKDGQMLVVDGILKLVQRPKKKNRKHLEILGVQVSEETMRLIQCTAGGVNEAVKREILLYRKEKYQNVEK